MCADGWLLLRWYRWTCRERPQGGTFSCFSETYLLLQRFLLQSCLVPSFQLLMFAHGMFFLCPTGHGLVRQSCRTGSHSLVHPTARPIFPNLHGIVRAHSSHDGKSMQNKCAFKPKKHPQGPVYLTTASSLFVTIRIRGPDASCSSNPALSDISNLEYFHPKKFQRTTQKQATPILVISNIYSFGADPFFPSVYTQSEPLSHSIHSNAFFKRFRHKFPCLTHSYPCFRETSMRCTVLAGRTSQERESRPVTRQRLLSTCNRRLTEVDSHHSYHRANYNRASSVF
jgi:hypothetical protein